MSNPHFAGLAKYTGLAQYRHIVAESYARFRENPNPEIGSEEFRIERDYLFKNHALSPIPAAERSAYQGIPYAQYDPAWHLVVPIDYDIEPTTYEIDLPEGLFRYQSFAKVSFVAPTGEHATLVLYWITGYGGGLFLPFGDQTNNKTTYGGGRYLYDTIKGADLGISADTIVLDFNMAYHPSCYYSNEWICPLAPPENHLPFAVPVGEMMG